MAKLGSKVKVTDSNGVWVDDDGELLTVVWSSEGWIDLPEEYIVHDEFLPVAWPTTGHIDDSLNLTIIIEDSRFLNVNKADFEVIE